MNAVAATPAATPARDWLSPVELVLLAAIWGGSFFFMRVAAPEFGPLPLVLLRLGLGALVLAPFIWTARARFARRHLWQMPALGLVMAALPFALFAWAAERAPAAIGAIANATTVLFTALIALVFFGERIGWRRGIALLVGFAGVVVLAGGGRTSPEIGWAALACTVAAACYGVSANLVRHYFADFPPVALAASTLLGATLAFAPLGLWYWPETMPSLRAWGCAIALGAVCTGLANAFYFRLLQRIGAPRAVTVTYLIPVFGVTWAWWLLDEPLTLGMAAAGALILASVAISQKR
jgi:drug/metabolite transporter (DMT)-like permease